MTVFFPRTRVPIPTKDVCTWIFDEPKHDIERPCLVDGKVPSRSVNLVQARTLVRNLVAGLRAAGVRSDDTVCLHLSNSIYYPVLLLAVIGIGAVYLGTNPAYSATELTHQLKHGEAKWIITETGGEGHPILKTVEKAMSPCGIPKDKVLIFDHEDCDGDVEVPEGWTSWRSLLTHGEQDWIRFDNYERSRSTTAALMFSSGTTGFPKAIMISHMNIVAQTVGVFVDHPREYHISRIASLPMFHAAIGMPTNYSTLKEGQTSYIYKRFDPTEYLLAHAKYEVTEMLMVPPLVVACIKSSLPNKKECLKTVRWVQCGAAPMSKETQSPFQALLAPGANITQVFGMTEGASLVFLFPTGEADDSGSSGRQITNLEVKLIDAQTREAITTPSTSGEICIRGPTVTRGYFGDELANAKLFTPDNFLITGDIGFCSSAPTGEPIVDLSRDYNGVAPRRNVLSNTKDNEGLWYIIDRRREMIKVRGFQVAPAEIEAILLQHPDVLDAAVIGIPGNDEVGELIKAYVVKKKEEFKGVGDRMGVTEEELGRWVRDRLARFKWLTAGVRFVGAIPKTASGKILKKELREWSKMDERRAEAGEGRREPSVL